MARVCEACGYEWDIETNVRNLAHQDGQLITVDAEIFNKRMMTYSEACAACTTLEEFIEMGKARGYRPKWAYNSYRDYKARGYVSRGPR
jgi:hypothetical protein